MKKIISILAFLLAVCAAAAKDSGQEVHKFDMPTFMPKGQWAPGVQITAVSMSASDSDLMLFFSGIDGNAALSRYAINTTFCYHRNQAMGLRVSYASLRGNLDTGTIDLLNDGMQFPVNGLSMNGQSFNAGLFHRSYFGLDKRGRVAVFLEAAFGYTYTKTDAKLTTPIINYSDKLSLSFSPGIELFLLNNFSINFSIGLAHLSYSWCRSVSGNRTTGTRNAFDAKAKVNLSDLNFGLSLYF